MPRSFSASRRHVLLGLGLGTAVAPVALTMPPAAAARAGVPDVDPPECLADLVASGEVNRADFMAG